MYTLFSVNLHHFTVTKPKFRSKLPKFRSENPKFRSECNEISFFEFKNTFRSELPKFSEISPEIPFPPDGGIRSKTKRRTLLVSGDGGWIRGGWSRAMKPPPRAHGHGDRAEHRRTGMGAARGKGNCSRGNLGS